MRQGAMLNLYADSLGGKLSEVSERGKSLMAVLDQLCVWVEENRQFLIFFALRC